MYLNQVRTLNYLKMTTISSAILAIIFGLTYSHKVGIIISTLMIINFLYSWNSIKLKQYILIPQIIHFIFGSVTPWITLEVFNVHHQYSYLACLGWGLYFSSTSLTNELMDAKIDQDENSSSLLGKKKTISSIIFLQLIAFTMLNFSFLSGTIPLLFIGETILVITLLLIIKNLKLQRLTSQRDYLSFRKNYRHLLIIMICFWFLTKIF